HDYNPHLFIYSTTDGYHATGCFNGESGSECTQWINISNRYYPGYPLPVSVEGGARHELGLLTINIDQWWIQISVDGVSDYMGYYVASAFHGTMQTYADNFEAGGEVYDSTGAFTVPMGSGAWPALGLADAAYHHDIWAYGFENGVKTSWDTLTAVEARPGSYVYSSAPAGGSGWENYFYFGNALHLIIHWPPIILDQP
ncbi:MAG TPA: neprosin family prolyl endopeptidase, partial [Polyangia bacterium]|nr:neprosin family prolyl endopeptidase [Polyangia bacterium]